MIDKFIQEDNKVENGANPEEIRAEYATLYDALRQFIWPLTTVQALSDLEVALYDAFIDMDDARRALQVLRREIRDCNELDRNSKKYINIDESLDRLEDLLNSSDTNYVKLVDVNIPVEEEGKEDHEDEDEFGDIDVEQFDLNPNEPEEESEEFEEEPEEEK